MTCFLKSCPQHRTAVKTRTRKVCATRRSKNMGEAPHYVLNGHICYYARRRGFVPARCSQIWKIELDQNLRVKLTTAFPSNEDRIGDNWSPQRHRASI